MSSLHSFSRERRASQPARLCCKRTEAHCLVAIALVALSCLVSVLIPRKTRWSREVLLPLLLPHRRFGLACHCCACVCVHASACLCLHEARALLITNAQRLHCQLPLPLTLPHQSSTLACIKFFDPTCIHYSSNPDSPAEPLSATHCVISRYEQHTALHWQHLYCTAKHRTAQDAHTRPTAIGLALRQLKNEIERGKHRHHRDLTAAAPLHCVTGQIHPFDRPHYRQRTQSKPINHPQPCPARPPESIFLSSLTSR